MKEKKEKPKVFKRKLVTIYLSDADRKELECQPKFVDVLTLTMKGYRSKFFVKIPDYGYKEISSAKFIAGLKRLENSLEKLP